MGRDVDALLAKARKYLSSVESVENPRLPVGGSRVLLTTDHRIELAKAYTLLAIATHLSVSETSAADGMPATVSSRGPGENEQNVSPPERS